MRHFCGIPLVREGDTLEDAHIKEVGFPIILTMLIFGLTAIPFYLPALMIVTGIIICCVAMAIFVVGVLFNLVRPRYLVDVLLMMLTLGLWCMDVYNAALSQSWRSWAFIVLLLDLSLVFGRPRMPYLIIPSTIIYLLLQTVESFHEYGLYDIGQWGIHEGYSSCNCASPPCSDTPIRAVLLFCCAISVFLIDFFLTSEFANGMRLQLRSIESTVTVSEEVAEALAMYDVDAAERAIAEDEDLPPKLKASFRQLLANLRSYRAYLPHSCLVPTGTFQDFDIHCIQVETPKADPRTNSPLQDPTQVFKHSSVDLPQVLRSPPDIIRSPPDIMRSPSATGALHLPSGLRSSSTSTLRSGLRSPSTDRRKSRMRSFVASGIGRRSMDVIGLGRRESQWRRESSVSKGSSGGQSTSRSEEPSGFVRSLKMARKRCRVSLAAVNTLGYLATNSDLSGETHNVWMSGDIEKWCSTVFELKGVVDLMAGDRRYATFNARQGCAAHASAAVEALSSREGQVSGCVVTGQAVCGDFGSESVLRFMVLGVT
eukprot:Hpha_TRINITY_DN16476_c5_g2::TRINITY_DN16476_c5_g2_i1::g.160566::m.160566